MKIYILKKEKGKTYESKDICSTSLSFDLQYDGKKPLGCSISDTKNYWAIAIGECGLDIEEKGRVVKKTTVSSLHPKEAEYLNALSFGSLEWNEEFLNIWTAKEAYYKLFGLSFKMVSVLDEDLNYKKEEQGFGIYHFEHKDLIGCLVSREAPEIEYIIFSGRSAKPVFEYAISLIAERPYASKELGDKLKIRGYCASEIEETLARFKELSYLNDEEYALNLIERLISEGKGNRYIKEKLSLKGLDASLLSDYSDEFERALKQALLMKGKTAQQIGRRLYSMGFGQSTIYKVLANIR